MESGKVKIGLVVVLIIILSIPTIIFIKSKTASIDDSMITENIVTSESNLKFSKEDEKLFEGTWKVSNAKSKDTNEDINLESVLIDKEKENQVLTLDSDKSFVNNLYKETNDASNTGTYALRENQAGKYQLYLEYNDGNIDKLDIEKEDDTYHLLMEKNEYSAILYLDK